MENAEKELEEHILEVGNRITAFPSHVDDLLRLLDQAETFLSRVEQSPSQSMLAALRPAMTGLTAKQLLRHSDIDVRVAVASCVSEITRITAPEVPYDDDLMQEIFQMIVEAFRKLDDISSRSYSKRVSILETVAKVRSCVVMLDLECDSLILEMFQHFLSTIRDNHPENIFSSMEMIMTLVLEESEDVSSDLLSCLLKSVKKSNKDILPIARKLAEKVIGNCVLKLKPYLMGAVQPLGASLNDYSKIVASVCQENSDVLEDNGANISLECLADESKLSERTVSDEMPQGSGKLESEVSRPELSHAADKLPGSSANNGTGQTGNDDSLVETSPTRKTESSCLGTFPKNVSAARLEADKLDNVLHRGSNKAMVQKSNSIVQSTEVTDHPQVEAVELPNRRKGRSREADTLQSERAKKRVKAIRIENHEKGAGRHEKSTNNSASAVSPAHNEKLPNLTRPKRGRSSGSKVSMKKGKVSTTDDMSVSPSSSKKCPLNGNTEVEAVPSMDAGMKNQNEGTGDSEKKHLRQSGKRGRWKASSNSHSQMAIDEMEDPEGKLHRRPGRKAKRVGEVETLGKPQVSKTKQQKGRTSWENNVVAEQNLKGRVSSSDTTKSTEVNKDQTLLEESLKIKSRKKRIREETSETPRDASKYDESLVGVRIKVWWPEDEQFYPGVIDSYDPATMKHKVLYADGDVEDLVLKDELFELLKGEKQVQVKNDSTPEAASIMRQKTKTQDSSEKKSKVVSGSKSEESAGEVHADRTKSGGKHEVDSTKSTGGRRGGCCKTDESTQSRSKSKEKKRRRFNVDTPKGGKMLKDELKHESEDASPRATKSKDDTTKPGRKSKSGTPEAGSRLKDSASKVGSLKGKSAKFDSNANDVDVASAGSKRKSKIPSPGKRGSKSDANGFSKGKTGSSKRRRTEYSATEADSAHPVSQDDEGKGGKKGRKNSQS